MLHLCQSYGFLLRINSDGLWPRDEAAVARKIYVALNFLSNTYVLSCSADTASWLIMYFWLCCLPFLYRRNFHITAFIFSCIASITICIAIWIFNKTVIYLTPLLSFPSVYCNLFFFVQWRSSTRASFKSMHGFRILTFSLPLCASDVIE